MAADNRNFVNTIDNAGTEVLVEDKRLYEMASATGKTASEISTSTQFIPLQDTDGNIVKISPASFQEAVRNVLAGLLVNNDKGTTFDHVPVIGSSDFGSSTLANLASVLGGTLTIKETSFYARSNKYLVITLPVSFFSAIVELWGYQPSFSGVLHYTMVGGYSDFWGGKILTGSIGDNKVYTNKAGIIVVRTAVTNSQIDGIVKSHNKSYTVEEVDSYDVSGFTEITFA